MPLSPKERIRQLDELLRDKEEEKKRLKEQEELTEKELARAKKEIEEEMEALRNDEEVQEFFARVRLAESRGMTDREAEEALHRRGLHIQHLMRETTSEETQTTSDEESDEEEKTTTQSKEENLEARLADVTSNTQKERNFLYDIQQRLLASSYDFANKNTLQGLQAMNEAIRQGRDLSENEYGILQQFRDTVEAQANNPYYAEDDPRRVYATKANEVVDSIRENLGLRIGDTYLREEH